VKSAGVIAALLMGLLLSSAATAADLPDGDWNTVRSLFAVGRFAEARELTDVLTADAPHDDQSLYWRYRLAESPSAARDLRLQLLSSEQIGPAARSLLLHDGAWIAYGSGDYDTALELLDQVLVAEDETAATVGLLGGLAWRAQGLGDRSRNALAAVPQDDPDYPWARYRLGQLALIDGDVALAKRYLEMAGDNSDSPCAAEILLTEWMLAGESDPQRAVRLERELVHRYPHSLPAALVAEQAQKRHDLQRRVNEPDPPSDDAADAPADNLHPGRYTLQFAAFADRARALAFLDDWRSRLPGLSVVPETDDRGKTLYKLRAGSYAGISQAHESAADFTNRFDLVPLPIKAAISP
jgi:hypothetical protein